MIRKVVVAAAALALLGACGDSSTTEPRVPSSVQLDRQTLNLSVGDTVRVEAVILDQDGRAFDVPPEGFTIMWSSNATSVATVDASGLVTAVGTGQARIRATAGTLPPAEMVVDSEGHLTVAGAFDLPVIFDDDTGDRVVTAYFDAAYSGHRAGGFLVDDTFELGDVDGQGSYAYTFYNDEYDDQDFIAWERRADGRLDYMEFYVSGGVLETGSYQPYLGFLFLGYNLETDIAENLYILEAEAEAGILTVTAIDADQVVGTFSLPMDAAAMGTTADPGAAAAALQTVRRPLRGVLRQ
jgi:hypothetical protein